MNLLFAITILVPMAVLASEERKADVRPTVDVNAMLLKIQDLSERFAVADRYKANFAEVIKPNFTNSIFENGINMMDEIRVNFLRGRIQSLVYNINRTVTHGLGTSLQYKEKADEITAEYRRQTEARIERENNNALGRIADMARGSKIIKLIPCVGKLLEEAENMKITAKYEAKKCISSILAVFKYAIQDVLCDLLDALENIEVILQGLVACDKTSGSYTKGNCLDQVIATGEGVAGVILNKILGKIIGIGELFKALIATLSNCVDPIVNNLVDSLGQLAITVQSCLAPYLQGR